MQTDSGGCQELHLLAHRAVATLHLPYSEADYTIESARRMKQQATLHELILNGNLKKHPLWSSG